VTGWFTQVIIVLANTSDPSDGLLSAQQTVSFCQEVMESYTPEYGDMLGPPMIKTTCEFLNQNITATNAPSPAPASDESTGSAGALLRRLGMVMGLIDSHSSLDHQHELRSQPAALAVWGGHRLESQKSTTSAGRTNRALSLGDKHILLEYSMVWSSKYSGLEGYDKKFEGFINTNKDTVVLRDLRNIFIFVTQVHNVTSFTPEPTERPTPTPAPNSAEPTTVMPTVNVTANVTLEPTVGSTAEPTTGPTVEPTSGPTVEPTSGPTSAVPVPTPSSSPTAAPNPASGKYLTAGAIAAIAIGGLLVLVGVGIFCLLHRQKKLHLPFLLSGREEEVRPSTTLPGGAPGRKAALARSKDAFGDEEVGSARVQAAGVSTTEGGTLRTEVSTASPTRPEAAANVRAHKQVVCSASSQTVRREGAASAGVEHKSEPPDMVPPHLLQEHESSGRQVRLMSDDFDYFKDQNIEAMRTEVQDAVKGTDDMLSQAVTRALISSETSGVWGEDMGGTEIEASILYETHTWMRKTTASISDRRIFMQDMLNKMVLCVRNGFVPSDKASRTIHECAALLGLEIAEEIPKTSLMVTHMRKAAKTEDLRAAFKAFGAMEEAAVAPKESGFGLVRFVSAKGVLRAMEQSRLGEIIVQDVAVRVLVIGESHGARSSVSMP